MSPNTEGSGPKRGLILSATSHPATTVEYAVAAEEGGWDGVFHIDHLVDFTASSPDTHQPLNDPWITWAGVASRTEEITLGSYVTPIPRRQPQQLARNLATLDQLSDGRVLLGAGLGAPWDYQAFGEPYDQRRLAARYDEALDVLTGLWTGEPFSYDGEHFTVEDAILRPTPVQEPRIPIVIGGWWPFKKPFQRAARWDGMIPQWPSKFIGESWVADMGDHMQRVIPDEPAHEAEVSDMVAYYEAQCDDPGEVILPVDVPAAPPDFPEFCESLGATWLLHDPLEADATTEENVERIRGGPTR
jgi:hypothetical protein